MGVFGTSGFRQLLWVNPDACKTVTIDTVEWDRLLTARDALAALDGDAKTQLLRELDKLRTRIAAL